jgi:hypothetical protein
MYLNFSSLKSVKRGYKVSLKKKDILNLLLPQAYFVTSFPGHMTNASPSLKLEEWLEADVEMVFSHQTLYHDLPTLFISFFSMASAGLWIRQFVLFTK